MLAELINQMRTERAALKVILDGATDEELGYVPPGRWSASEILRHLMDFEDDVMQGLRELAQGQTPSWMAVRDRNARNAQKAQLWPSRPLADIRADFEAHRKELESHLLALTEEELADPRYFQGFRSAAEHDFEHIAGIQERLAQARGDVRAATVHWVDISRRNLLTVLRRIPLEAYDESLPGKWSIKEILLHLAIRDRMWTGTLSNVIGGGSDDWPHNPDELDAWNQAEVAKLAHLPPQQVLYVLGEARGEWNQIMLMAPDWLVADERYRRWAVRRIDHDRWHLSQIVERFDNWRSRRDT